MGTRRRSGSHGHGADWCYRATSESYMISLVPIRFARVGLGVWALTAVTLAAGCNPTIGGEVALPPTPDLVARATAAVAQRGGDVQVQATVTALQATNDAL